MSSRQSHAVTGAYGNSYGYDSRLTAVKEGDELLAGITYDADGVKLRTEWSHPHFV